MKFGYNVIGNFLLILWLKFLSYGDRKTIGEGDVRWETGGCSVSGDGKQKGES